MLSAVPDLIPDVPWVQVLGRVAIHHSDDNATRLTGSGQRLLAVFVAAGPDGATAERIAEEIWGAAQPNPWRPALRMAIARLRKQLPTGWDIVADGGSYRITTATGWVDAWRLTRDASEPTEVEEANLDWALAGTPFGDIDSLELVGSSAQHLQMLQITLAERFCLQRPTAMSTRSCAVLSALLREHPFNDGLAMVVAETLAGADRRIEAMLSLRSFAETYSVEFGAVPLAIANFLSAAESRTSTSTEVPAHAATIDTPVRIAKELRHLLDAPMLGRSEELERVRAAHGAIITGTRGSGKSRLVAELISTDAATDTTYVAGDDRLELQLGPFVVAMAPLRDELIAMTNPDVGPDSGSPERAMATKAWRIVLRHLEERSMLRPQRLVVDDAHLLDPTSLALLRLLIRSNTSANVSFVVCGRSDIDDSIWLDLVTDAKRAGLEPVALDGLELEEIEQLVHAAFPTASHQARHGLAVDVQEASAGLPAVAAPLIASADPSTLALPDHFAGASGLVRLTARFIDSSSEVVASAAVLGHQFSIGTLIELTGLTETAVFQVLDELWSAGIIVETDDPDQVRFQHVLMQRAFLEALPLFRRGQLHRRAAELVDDVHERAAHHSNAGALVSAEVAASSLRRSADVYAERRMWRKVGRELRRIDELSSDMLDAKGYALWAAALDQSGSDGWPQRRIAYQRSVAKGDWQTALVAALSGLPAAEELDGDPERVEMLTGIPDDELSIPQRFERLYHLSRLSSTQGNYRAALSYGDQALASASGPDEVTLGHILQWTATRYAGPDRYVIPDEVGSGLSSLSDVRLLNVRAIDFAERGDFGASRRLANDFQARALEIDDPLLCWHAQALQTMHLLNDGLFDLAQIAARDNLKLTEVHDLQYGHAAYIGQQVFASTLLGELSTLGAQIEPVRATLARFMLGRAALILTDHAMGRPRIASELKALLAELRHGEGTSSALVASVMLAGLVAEHAPEAVAPMRSQLEPFGDRPILPIHGGGNYGPTTRYVAQLALSTDQKVELLDRSIAAADRQGPLIWRIHCRLDRARIGKSSALAEAAELAAGTELAKLVGREGRQLNSS